jgi:hypothetical protein
MADVAARIEESGRRRFAGIDRGTIAPPLLVLGLAVLMSVVLRQSTVTPHIAIQCVGARLSSSPVG